MKKLNIISTGIFAALLDGLHTSKSIEAQIKGNTLLCFELTSTPILTEYGTGSLYTLVHFKRVDGANKGCPEMRFLVIDNRNHPAQLRKLLVFPAYYNTVGLPADATSILSIQTMGYNIISHQPYLQARHASLAESWLYELNQQGFISLLQSVSSH